MDFENATHFLSENGWLAKLPPRMRDDWLRGARLTRFSPGEQIFTAQDDPRYMIGLAEGTIGALVSYNPQEARLITLYSAGNWFGDAAVLTRSAHRGTALARTDCTCLIVSVAHVDAVATLHPEVWRWIAMNVVFQFDSYTTLTEAALNRDPICRLITMLLSLRKLNPQQTSFDLSTEEIGQMVGLTRNTVSKCLRELEQAHIIGRSYARLTVPSFEVLTAELRMRTSG